jgi:SAM-dependent methyltransferase
MWHPDAQRWNARYQAKQDYYLARRPHELLCEHEELLPKTGRVLDLAAGVSPTGLFLAKRGLQVIAFDISSLALRLLQQRFKDEGLRLDCALIDLTDPWLPVAHFDVILDFYFLSHSLLDRCRSALKPGGLLFCELLLWDNNPGSRRSNYLESGELQAKFSDWPTIYSNEGKKSGHGSQRGPRPIVQLVTRKPRMEKA